MAGKAWGQPLGQLVSEQNPRQELMIGLHAAGSQGLTLDLSLRGGGDLTLTIGEHLYSLPQLPGLTIQPRPDWMMPSPTFITDFISALADGHALAEISGEGSTPAATSVAAGVDILMDKISAFTFINRLL